MSSDQSDRDTDEIVAAVKDELAEERFIGDKVLVSRRELVGLAAGTATVAGILGHETGTASAQSSGTGRLGDPTPLEYVGANALGNDGSPIDVTDQLQLNDKQLNLDDVVELNAHASDLGATFNAGDQEFYMTALRVVPTSQGSSAKTIARFRGEAQTSDGGANGFGYVGIVGRDFTAGSETGEVQIHGYKNGTDVEMLRADAPNDRIRAFGWGFRGMGHAQMQQRGDPSTGEIPPGECMTYCSDGSGTGSAGDLVYAVNDGGTIKTSIVAQRSNATA